MTTGVSSNGLKPSFIQSSPRLDGATFNLMVYGEPGEGKTPMIVRGVLKSPDLCPALLVDIDGGTLSIAGIPIDTIHIADYANELTIAARKENPGAPSISRWLALMEVGRFLVQQKHEYRTVILDSATEIGEDCENQVIEEAKLAKSEHDKELAELADYRRSGNRLLDTLDRFNKIITIDGRHLNLIATAREVRYTDRKTSEVTVRPMFRGGLPPEIMAKYDSVLRLYTGEAKDAKGNARLVKCLLTRSTDKFKARERSGAFQDRPVIEDPDFAKVFAEIISAKLKEAKPSGKS